MAIYKSLKFSAYL